MAYKNKKSNKRHIKELRQNSNDFYNKRRRKKRRKETETGEFTLEELEQMIKKLG